MNNSKPTAHRSTPDPAIVFVPAYASQPAGWSYLLAEMAAVRAELAALRQTLEQSGTVPRQRPGGHMYRSTACGGVPVDADTTPMQQVDPSTVAVLRRLTMRLVDGGASSNG